MYMNVKKLFDLTGGKAIVTGSAQGLGKEMAIAIAEAGADVAIIDINMDGALSGSHYDYQIFSRRMGKV